jgi:plasmid replication initiation protein
MDNKKELVVMSNRLVEASYRLTLVEHRIILMAIVQARETGKGLNSEDRVEITVADYGEHFPDSDSDYAYSQLREAAETLFRREFIMRDTDPKTGKPRVNKERWVSGVSYSDGVIGLRFSSFVIPFITQLQREFTSYRLEKIAKMSSPYAIRLYELLMQWGSVGKREVELVWLKRTLMLEDKYSSIKDFKNRVIDVATNQINEFTDMTVSYTQKKKGRTITHLIFEFLLKKETKTIKTKAMTPDVWANLQENRGRTKGKSTQEILKMMAQTP